MTTVTLSAKYQVVIPKALRRALGLKDLFGTVPGPNNFVRDKDRKF
jgi:hypothetical protein